MKSLLISALAGTICLAASVAVAQPSPPALKKKFMKTELGLDDRQIDKIEDLTYRSDRARLDIRHKLQQARLDLKHMMGAGQPEKKTVFAQLEKIATIELALKKNRIGLMLEIRKLLTPAQWEKMELFHARRKERRVRRERRDRRERRELRERRSGRRMSPPDAPDAPEEPPPSPPPGP